jgi:hypothetical protein
VTVSSSFSQFLLFRLALRQENEDRLQLVSCSAYENCDHYFVLRRCASDFWLISSRRIPRYSNGKPKQLPSFKGNMKRAFARTKLSERKGRFDLAHGLLFHRRNLSQFAIERFSRCRTGCRVRGEIAQSNEIHLERDSNPQRPIRQRQSRSAMRPSGCSTMERELGRKQALRQCSRS